ncbi:MAG: RNA methyltransferase [Flavobacteriaceae bacterium]|nr:MAG: RNA methyltransferase [Flavobacteriaceae bacterium]
MAVNEFLADRIRNYLLDNHIDFFEKRMFGGLTFMVDNKMCVGLIKGKMMSRIGPDAYKDALLKEGCTEMKFTGKPMIGYVFLNDEATDLEVDLEYWISLALDFNPLAKASKKNKEGLGKNQDTFLSY